MAAAVAAVKKGAGFVVFRRLTTDVEYLLLKSSYGTHHWSPPKGYVDPGEAEFQAAIRETFEETGLTCDDLFIFHNFKKTLKYDVQGDKKEVTYWLAELITDKPIELSDEHTKYTWLNLMQACVYIAFIDAQQLLQECDAFINSPPT